MKREREWHSRLQAANNPLALQRNDWLMPLGLSTLQNEPTLYQFRSPAHGLKAGLSALRIAVESRGARTLSDVLAIWHPNVTQGDPELYLARIQALTGLQSDQPLNPLDPRQMLPLLKAMARLESGAPPTNTLLLAAWHLYLGG